MKIPRIIDVRKVWEILAVPEERWRLTLLRNRRAVKKHSSRIGDGDVAIELEALGMTARQHPEALQLAVRKHWRAEELETGLALVEDVWRTSGKLSGNSALACAKTWHQYGRTKQADEALAAAKLLSPDDIDVWALEAGIQANRGNAHAAVNAAENALGLASEHATVVKWRAFLGQQYFGLGQHERVVEYLEPVLRENIDWRRHYEYGVSLEFLGRLDDGRRELIRCAAAAVPQAKSGFEIVELHFKAERHQAMLDELRALPTSRERSRLMARAMLALGKFDDCVELAFGESRTGQLAEYGALALELSGRLPEALEAYAELSKTLVSRKRRTMILRRFARVAHQTGTHETSVHAELLYSNNVDQLGDLDKEVDPDFENLRSKTNKHLNRGNWGEAIENLKKMALRASSGRNISRVNRVLGILLADSGDFPEASTAFFKGNPFPMPNAGEANAKPSALRATERYSETITSSAVLPRVVLYESFYGAKTACNPLALCLALLERPEGAEMEHIWALKDGVPIHPALLGRPNVHFVRYMSTGYLTHLATAGILINNSTFPRWFIRREEQRYVNTWHGTPWKHMGLDVLGDAFSFENVARNFLQTSDLLLPNQFTATKLLETQDVASLIRRNPVAVGSPRVDRSLNQTITEKDSLRNRLGLRSERPVVFYAPTWRGTMEARQSTGGSVAAVARTLARHDVDVVIRAHYFDQGTLRRSQLPSNVFLPGEEFDSNELLGITDILVSDYSSIIFDFAPLNRPIIKHVYDLDSYTRQRGLYFDVEDVPGLMSKDLEELDSQVSRCLDHTGDVEGREKLRTAPLWKNEDGQATARALEVILGDPQPIRDRSLPLLISMNSLNPNGITRSFGNLIHTSASRVGHIQTMLPSRFFANAESENSAMRLRGGTAFTLRSSFHTGTRQERNVWSKLAPLREPFPRELVPWVRSRMKTEFQRMFGDTRFAAAMDFDGHDLYSAALIAYGPGEGSERIYVGHNEFCAEMSMRFPNHRGIGSILEGFSKIAAVSPAVMEANRDGLASTFGVREELHTVLPNTLNVEEILQCSQMPLDDDLEDWFCRPGIHLIMVGRLSPEKNHRMAFESLKRARAKGDPADILVLGDGPLRADLNKLVVELGLEGSVFFAGQRTNPYAAMHRADALLLSSRHEGQPMVFLEAMTLGTPIAATRIPASVSTLENGKHGLLIDLSIEGIESAITALSEGTVASAKFDSGHYREEAVQRFLELIQAE